MTREQAEIIISLIDVEARIASHPQNPPRFWMIARDELRERLLNTTILLPGQRCRVDGYKDSRPQLTNEEWSNP